jgi:hypothetical protein
MHAGLRRSPAQIEVHQRRALAPAPSRAMWASQARLSPVPWSDGGACGFFDHRCQPTSLRLFINPRREREREGGGGGKGAEQHQARRAASGRQGGAIGVRASSYSMGDRGLSSTGSAWCTAFSCHRMRAAEAWRKGRARVHQQRVHTLDESWRRRWRPADARDGMKPVAGKRCDVGTAASLHAHGWGWMRMRLLAAR